MNTNHRSTTAGAVFAGLLTLLAAGCSKPAEPVAIAPVPAVAAAPATTVGTDLDDSVVTTSVKTALLSDAAVKSFDIKVETRKGEVQLSGFVDNQGQIDRAVEVARGVSGVGSVGNEMSVKK